MNSESVKQTERVGQSILQPQSLLLLQQGWGKGNRGNNGKYPQKSHTELADKQQQQHHLELCY